MNDMYFGFSPDEYRIFVREIIVHSREDIILTSSLWGNLRVLGNARIVRYLAQHHQEFLAEFQKAVDVKEAA